MGRRKMWVGEFNPQRMGNQWFKTVSISVAANTSSGSSAADPELAGGAILGYYPVTNQDQLVDDITLGANGAVTVTLAANATAINYFRVVVMKKPTFGTT